MPRAPPGISTTAATSVVTTVVPSEHPAVRGGVPRPPPDGRARRAPTLGVRVPDGQVGTVAHVSMITLGVDDVAASARFYEALGWRRSSASVDGVVAFLRGGAVVLGLYGRDDLAADAGVTPRPAGGPQVALATNVASPQAVDELIAAAISAGGRATRPAQPTDWGGYAGYVADPDGHLWEVAHNPGFELLADGRVRLPDD